MRYSQDRLIDRRASACPHLAHTHEHRTFLHGFGTSTVGVSKREAEACEAALSNRFAAN